MSESPEIENTGTEQQSHASSLGEVLRVSREKKGLTQQDVSGNLRYSVKQIEALERNEFDKLPDAMITRGFIRNYARLLEIDAEPLLASYKQNAASETDKLITVQSSIRPVSLTKESQPWFKYIMASILVLLFLLAWLFYIDYTPKQADSQVAKTPEVVEEATPAKVEPLPEVALPAAQRQADGGAAAANIINGTEATAVAVLPAAANVKPADEKQAEAVAADLKPAPALPGTDTKPLAQPPAQSVKQVVPSSVKPADKTVNMTFTAQSWVSVTDKTGKVIFEKIAHGGDNETINAPLPLNVVIGNAAATKLSLGGQDIDLAKNTKSNVARITLE